MQLPAKSKPQNILADVLRREIVEHGPITFAHFMEMALYHPQHGYYKSGRAQIGRTGDYFTSVSVGSLFGRLMARQFREMRELLGSPADFVVVEQGAGSGRFARDIANAAPELRYLALDHGENLPPFHGVHFSNELLDSFPVHVVKWSGAEWREQHVAADDERFAFVDLPITDPELRERVAKIPLPLPAGYQTEVNLAALRWIELVAQKLERGFILAIDYGFPRDEYYAPHRSSGTLRSYSQHRLLNDVLSAPGEVDLTTHVEWSSLVEHALSLGLRLAGFTDQHHFLTGLLTDELARELEHHPKTARALQTLIHPAHLGMKFQVLVLARGVPGSLAGLRFARPPAL